MSNTEENITKKKRQTFIHAQKTCRIEEGEGGVCAREKGATRRWRMTLNEMKGIFFLNVVVRENATIGHPQAACQQR